MRVPGRPLEHLDLDPERGRRLLVLLEGGLVHDLDCILDTRLDVSAMDDLAEATLAKLVA